MLQAVFYDCAGELLIVFALSFLVFVCVLRQREDAEELEELRAENEQLRDELHAAHLRSANLVRIMPGKRRRELQSQASNVCTPTQPVPASAMPQCAGLVSPIASGVDDSRATSARGTRAREEGTRCNDHTRTTPRSSRKDHGSSTTSPRYPGPSTRAKSQEMPVQATRALQLSSGTLFYSHVVQRQMKGAMGSNGEDAARPRSFESWLRQWKSLPHQQSRGETAMDPHSPCSAAAVQGAQGVALGRSSSMRELAMAPVTPMPLSPQSLARSVSPDPFQGSGGSVCNRNLHAVMKAQLTKSQ